MGCAGRGANEARKFGRGGRHSAKQKRLCLIKETKAQTSAVPLFLPGRRRSGHSGMPGNGGGPEGPTAVSALCSKGIFPVSSRPPCTKRRLSVRLGGGYSAFSAQFQRYTLLSYPLPSGLSRRFCGFLPFFPWTSPFPLYFSALLWYNFPRNSRLRRRKGGSIP